MIWQEKVDLLANGLDVIHFDPYGTFDVQKVMNGVADVVTVLADP